MKSKTTRTYNENSPQKEQKPSSFFKISRTSSNLGVCLHIWCISVDVLFFHIHKTLLIFCVFLQRLKLNTTIIFLNHYIK